MVELFKPKVADLWFREKLLSDEDTMSYNHAWGGTIPFPKEKWENWHNRWVKITITSDFTDISKRMTLF